MTDDRDICERLEDTNYDGAFAMRREAAKLIRQLRHYVDRLEDDLRYADLETEKLRKHIAQQQLDIVVLGQEAGRMREALLHCANSIAEWERKPEGVAPFLLGALDNARTVLGEEKE
jgi:hypothetical protein